MTQPLPIAAYSAAQIGRALGLSARRVRQELTSLPSMPVSADSGQLARGWPLAALSRQWQNALQAHAKDRGFRSAEELLRDQSRPWSPTLPLSQIAPDSLEKAAKLKRALMPTLVIRQGDRAMSMGEIERLGIEDYRREFGFSITARHFRSLLKRTITRDAGAEQWERIEIYLDENPARKNVEGPKVACAESVFAELREWTEPFKVRRPTRKEEDSLWNRAMEVFDMALSSEADGKKLSIELRAFLWATAPWLSRSENALRMMIQRKRAAWEKAEGEVSAVLDGREARLGVPSGQQFAQRDLDVIIWHAGRNCGGRVAQAAREIRQNPEVLGPNKRPSEEFVQFLEDHCGGSKSYLVRRIQRKVKAEVERLKPFFIGPRAVDKATASMILDHRGIPSMFCVTGDDTTLPVKFAIPVSDHYVLRRGQFLVFIDYASLRILGFALIPNEGYSSLHIYTQETKIFLEHGTPQVLMHERGIWKNSTLLKGDSAQSVPDEWEAGPSWKERELGLRRYMEFIHCRRARSKPIERVIALLQNYMEREPGYCGRDEKVDCPERLKKIERLLVTGQARPGEVDIYEFGPWNARLREICQIYNATPQEGRILDGLSPDQAFEQLWPNDDPPSRFDARCAHLLTHYRRPGYVIGANGIRFSIGSTQFQYLNEKTSELKGERVVLHFSPECPEFIVVTDMNDQNAFTVERSESPHALEKYFDPGAGTLERQSRRIAAHNAYPKARFNLLKAQFAPTFRANVVDAATIRTGQEISQLITERTEQNRREQVTAAKARKLASDLGMSVANRTLRPETVESMAKLKELLLEPDEEGEAK